MALFSNDSILCYERIKPAIAPKDGLIHTITITDKDKVEPRANWVRQYSFSINDIIEGMQKDGYEILNVNQNVASYGEDEHVIHQYALFSTLIVYK